MASHVAFVVAEKPSIAQAVAKALAKGSPRKLDRGRIPVYECDGHF